MILGTVDLAGHEKRLAPSQWDKRARSPGVQSEAIVILATASETRAVIHVSSKYS